jgi:cytochrome c556
MTRFFRMTVLAAALAASGGALADDQDVIDYRKHVMKTIGEQVGAVQLILENRVPADNLAVHLAVIAATAPQAKSAFTAEVAGGRSKPEVWANWDDFSQRLDRFVAGAQELAQAAQAGDAPAAAAKLPATLDCKGCHEVYRAPVK